MYSDASSLAEVTTELEGAGADSKPDQRSEDKAVESTVQEVPVESQGTSLRDDGSSVDDEVEPVVEVASSAPQNPSAEDKDEDQKGEEEVTAVAK